MKPDMEQILEEIEKRRDHIIQFLQALVSIPSVTGEELEIQKFISMKVNAMGLQVDLWEPDTEELKKASCLSP